MNEGDVGLDPDDFGSGGAGGSGAASASGRCQDTIFQYPSSLAHSNAIDVFFRDPAMRKLRRTSSPYSRDSFVGPPGVSRLAQSNLVATLAGTL